MIKVDGYRAFHGTIHVTPTGPGFAPYDVTGDCLYKPETECWYVQPEKGVSQSVPADICEVIENG